MKAFNIDKEFEIIKRQLKGTKFKDETFVCPSCKIKAIKLVPLFDDGTGIKICHKCKKNIKTIKI